MAEDSMAKASRIKDCTFERAKHLSDHDRESRAQWHSLATFSNTRKQHNATAWTKEKTNSYSCLIGRGKPDYR